MKNKELNNGITLIALVVTIVVLLILAGTSIAMLSGDNGIITKATQAQSEQADATVKEAVSLAWNEYRIRINTTGKIFGYNLKIASTKQIVIQGEKNNYLSSASITFFDFLKDEMSCIDENGIINVEALVGQKLNKGNGTGTNDVYKIERQGTSYILKYYETNEKNKFLWEVSASEEYDWEEIFETATKHPAQSSTNDDIGLDENGNSVNMDNWEAFEIFDSEISLAEYSGSGAAQTGYKGDIIGGKIDGKIPKYVKLADSDEFLPVTDISGLFQNLTDLTEAPNIPNTVKNMYQTFLGCTNLTTVSEIPQSVETLYRTFYNCSKLTGTIQINTNYCYYYYSCFYGAATEPGTDLILTGTSSIIDELIETASSTSNIRK